MSDRSGCAGLTVRASPCIVVGSGVAGLTAALALAPRPITVLTKRRDGGATAWARGGIAAAVGPGDSAAAHAADTLAVGDGLNEPTAVARLTMDGAARIADLVGLGMTFDGGRAPLLGREAGHSRRRILHADGDATGAAVLATLLRAAELTASITLLDGALAWDLVVAAGRVRGLIAFHDGEGWVFHRSDRVILATGGIGQAYRATTNPVDASGDGVAMAARAGAALADMEFVQFHPTALAVGEEDGGALPLLTEALRGDGAQLIDGTGRRFMIDVHVDAELAPRDVVARAVWRRVAGGVPVYLDLRPVAGLAERFPSADAACRRAGLDPQAAPVPVTVAAHYHMGGIATDTAGRTSRPGLWACGEVARTGAHGGNRLASNSLLEGLVFGRQAALDVAAAPGIDRVFPTPKSRPVRPPSARAIAAGIDRVRAVMTAKVAVARDGEGLAVALAELKAVERALVLWAWQPGQPHRLPTAEIEGLARVRNLALVGRLVATGALDRRESRGAHWRSDFPKTDEAWLHRPEPRSAEIVPDLIPLSEPAGAGCRAG